MNTTDKTRQAEIAHAVAVDTEIAEMWDEFWKVQSQVIRIEKQIDRDEKSLARYIKLDLQIRASEIVESINALQKKLESLRIEAEARREEAVAYDKANYKGWPRFFHVVHIHKSMHCSSFRPTTRVGWLPQLSGRTEAEAVAEQGESLCTICYPSAPVALTQKQADPNACAGSGKPYSKEHKTGREHSYYGAAGYCPECLRWQAVTKSGVMRKHKPNDETRRHALDKR